ncbi:MAG: class I tRNA ligase family protein [Actinomycetia bacterium]|nr:class I tRNA ligase family protein [Actinomycetes bacterium]
MNEKPGYKDTLNLPRTDFPMKANLPKLEPRLQEEWAKVGIEEELLKRRSDQKVFILHDGPPYANGDIHLGHTLNKVLKDIIVRSKSMTGFYSPYVPGWDCHGQPIEHEVEKRLSGDKSEISKSEIRQLCREYALNFVDRQREQFKRLGVFGLWDHPYLTMDRAYEGTIVRVFKELYRKGLVYKGRKPIHWCYRCRTALAEAEIEHEDAPSSSIYIRFPVLEGSSELDEFTEPKSLLVWTTTPWTLPANVAVAVNPVAEYVAARVEGEILVLAKELVDNVQEVINRKLDIVASFKGEALSKVVCRRPLEDEKSIVVMADFVELDQGTGCVHIAPGHGQEDHVVGLKYNLASPVPVDESGKFTAEAGQFAGQHINKANSAIVEELEKRELLVHSETITHSYPHCW